MTASHSIDNTLFIGIDVGGTGLDVAWHRGGVAHHENRPDAIATLVDQLARTPIARIAVEPTGGYEKPLVGALRAAGLPVELVDSTRFAAYRKLVGAEAKSDTTDARLLAAFAAAPAEVRGRNAERVVLEHDAVREELPALAARRGQINRMIHDENCRLKTVRSDTIRAEINAHLASLRAAERATHTAMRRLVRSRADLSRRQQLLQTGDGRAPRRHLVSDRDRVRSRIAASSRTASVSA